MTTTTWTGQGKVSRFCSGTINWGDMEAEATKKKNKAILRQEHGGGLWVLSDPFFCLSHVRVCVFDKQSFN
jgi:hypothetical protein